MPRGPPHEEETCSSNLILSNAGGRLVYHTMASTCHGTKLSVRADECIIYGANNAALIGYNPCDQALQAKKPAAAMDADLHSGLHRAGVRVHESLQARRTSRFQQRTDARRCRPGDPLPQGGRCGLTNFANAKGLR